eukprot:1161887-Pleurochrysis_carterae.AAC.1
MLKYGVCTGSASFSRHAKAETKSTDKEASARFIGSFSPSSIKQYQSLKAYGHPYINGDAEQPEPTVFEGPIIILYR